MLCSSCKDILKFIAQVAGLIFLFYAAHFFQENVTITHRADIKDIIQIIITVIFGIITAFFSYYAYFLSKERFRLDLLEKRWPIYEEVLKFCSSVLIDGRIPPHSDRDGDQDRNERANKALQSAHSSFRGLGYHKARSLFGKDIEDYFKKINESYAWLVDQADLTEAQEEGTASKRSEHLKFMMEAVEKLPDIFRPYVYFGDHKENY